MTGAGPGRRTRFADEVVTMAHGAGGSAAEALLDAVFRPLLGDDELAAADDGAVLGPGPSSDVELVMSTDAFVVRPRRFPGGSIGTLAVCGTVNDLAVMGARPRWMSLAFVLEEGFAVAELRGIVNDIARTAAQAEVRIVAGDTKVVERGGADGLYITSTGIGERRRGTRPGATSVRPGDRVLVSGPLGDHGIAVLLARGDLALDADIESDCAPLNGLVGDLLDTVPGIRWMRDPTRGGLASALNELVRANRLSVTVEEAAVPVRPSVAGACELLGIDPLHVANEGKVVVVVDPKHGEAALAALQQHPYGHHAALIGEVTEGPEALVIARTAIGGTRILDMLVGDPLPRIC